MIYFFLECLDGGWGVGLDSFISKVVLVLFLLKILAFSFLKVFFYLNTIHKSFSLTFNSWYFFFFYFKLLKYLLFSLSLVLKNFFPIFFFQYLFAQINLSVKNMAIFFFHHNPHPDPNSWGGDTEWRVILATI